MIDRKDYIYTSQTVCVRSEFINGYEYAKVLDGTNQITVALSPMEILNRSLTYYGSGYEGAIESSRSILKGKYFLPVAVDADMGIVCFSTSSYYQKGRIWFVHSQITDIEEHSDTECCVHMNYGHSITLPVKKQHVETKRGQAATVHTTLLERKKRAKSLLFLFERNSGIILIGKHGRLNYLEKKAEE